MISVNILAIAFNDILASLSAITNVLSVEDQFYITDNSALCTLWVEKIRDKIGADNIGGPITINNNKDDGYCIDDVTVPTPNPMTFSSPPVSEENPLGFISMTATEANDSILDGVQYLFEETTGTTTINFEWRFDPELRLGVDYFTVGEEYCFRVKARDFFGNETAWSGIECTEKTGCGASPMYKNNKVTASALDLQTYKSFLPLLPTLLINFRILWNHKKKEVNK